MTTFWASILVFGMLIFFHELGHFAIAKLVGIKVYEFSLGFGPKLVGFSRADTDYNLRAFPLGGFVRMAGMDPEDEEVEDGSGFGEKSVWQRISVIFAGPLMNFVLAALLLASIFIFQGVPVSSTEIEEVLTDKPAAEAGFQAGDKIVAIEGQTVKQWERVVEIISSSPGERLEVAVERNDAKVTLDVVPEAREDGQGWIGIQPKPHFERQNPFSAVVQGVKYTVQVTFLIFDFIGKMIFGDAPADLGGPVRVVYEINRAAELGFIYLLQLAAFLSINLGLFNLFPIPALDGSRIVFLLWELIRGKPVAPEKENFIHLVGFGVLLLFIVFITYNDVLQLFGNNAPLP
ncbi:MAG: RIP metalloprotease RseP [Firmicutes bacterium]|nr:RIP metalloprotease RseP [Bacillota bacterium]